MSLPTILQNQTTADADEVMANFDYLEALIATAPRGTLVNGKFSVTDTGSGILITLTTLAGLVPSSTDPVLIRIGDTTHYITATYTRTILDGTNWGNAGSAELATKEIDWFLYAVWDSNSNQVSFSPSRFPGGNLVSDFSATTTNEKHLVGYAEYTSTDEVEVIGRFAATLSAGAGYTWSVPTYTASNLIQKPIYETRDMTFTITPSGTMTVASLVTNLATYKLRGRMCKIDFNFTVTTSGGPGNEISFVWPFTPLNTQVPINSGVNDSVNVAGFGYYNTTKFGFRKYDSSNYGTGAGRGPFGSFEYPI